MGDFQLARSEMRKISNDPLSMIVDFANSESDELEGVRAADDIDAVQQRQLVAPQNLLGAAAGVVMEVELSRGHLQRTRERWKTAFAAAIASPAALNVRPVSLLEVLLAIARLPDSVTGHTLAERFGGAAPTWTRKLTDLNSLGALTSDPIQGFRVQSKLLDLIRAASPQLLHSLRAGVLGDLPGGRDLRPLTGVSLRSGGRDRRPSVD